MDGSEPASSLPHGQDRDRKRDWRRRLTARRRAAAADAAAESARAQLVLALPEVVAARTVAAYVSMPTEPDTASLIDALTSRGVRVLLPVLLDDRDLDWAVAGPLVDGPAGLLEPTGPRLGPEAIRMADVILCPGLAADSAGTRLGRGGGSYDRALARCRPDAARVLLSYDGELVDLLPTDPHDEPVHVVVTPTRVVRLR